MSIAIAVTSGISALRNVIAASLTAQSESTNVIPDTDTLEAFDFSAVTYPLTMIEFKTFSFDWNHADAPVGGVHISADMVVHHLRSLAADTAASATANSGIIAITRLAGIAALIAQDRHLKAYTINASTEIPLYVQDSFAHGVMAGDASPVMGVLTRNQQNGAVTAASMPVCIQWIETH